MISVIIPTHNRSALLAEAVRSVCRQDFSDMELIIIDDGSTDDTRQLVAVLAGESRTPIEYIHQKNRGAAAARNTGIRASRGDLICFLDSDDVFVPQKLACQYNKLIQSNYLISHTREKWYRRGQLLNQKKKHQPPHGNIFTACLGMCVVGMSTVMARRQLFDQYGLFDETMPCCEDYDFWLRISPTVGFLLVDEVLTLKNGGRPDQLSAQYRMGMDRYRIGSLVKLLENIPLTEDQFAIAVAELKRKCMIYGTGCIKHGRVKEGESYLQIPDRFQILKP